MPDRLRREVLRDLGDLNIPPPRIGDRRQSPALRALFASRPFAHARDATGPRATGGAQIVEKSAAFVSVLHRPREVGTSTSPWQFLRRPSGEFARSRSETSPRPR